MPQLALTVIRLRVVNEREMLLFLKHTNEAAAEELLLVRRLTLNHETRTFDGAPFGQETNNAVAILTIGGDFYGIMGNTLERRGHFTFTNEHGCTQRVAIDMPADAFNAISASTRVGERIFMFVRHNNLQCRLSTVNELCRIVCVDLGAATMRYERVGLSPTLRQLAAPRNALPWQFMFERSEQAACSEVGGRRALFGVCAPDADARNAPRTSSCRG